MAAGSGVGVGILRDGAGVVGGGPGGWWWNR